MGGGHVAAEREGQLPRLHRGPRFAHDLQAAALRAADADDAHGEAIVGGRLPGRALLLGGEELPGIPGRQARGGQRPQGALHESTPRQISHSHAYSSIRRCRESGPTAAPRRVVRPRLMPWRGRGLGRQPAAKSHPRLLRPLVGLLAQLTEGHQPDGSGRGPVDHLCRESRFGTRPTPGGKRTERSSATRLIDGPRSAAASCGTRVGLGWPSAGRGRPGVSSLPSSDQIRPCYEVQGKSATALGRIKIKAMPVRPSKIAAVVRGEREIGPEVVMRMAEGRALRWLRPGGRHLPPAVLGGVAQGSRQEAGFDPEVPNRLRCGR